MYYSQWKQDYILDQEIFKGKENGVFIDVGAHDGISGSNSAFFEKVRKWKGICIEPIPKIFERLEKNRNCICVNGCAYSSTGTIKFKHNTGYTEMLSGVVDDFHPNHLQRIQNEQKMYGGESEIIECNSYTLTDLCNINNIFDIDFLSIDTEGSELKVLEGVDFDIINISVIVFEDNYPQSSQKIKTFLSNKGYKLYKKTGGDLIYIRDKN